MRERTILCEREKILCERKNSHSELFVFYFIERVHSFSHRVTQITTKHRVTQITTKIPLRKGGSPQSL